ncbi:MAG: carbohydrate porin [Bacteroidales bacterium]|nr:carbohydrate porin [Bacteroidales bacterium]
MKTKNRFMIFMMIIIITKNPLKAQETTLPAISFGASYTGDVVSNFKGGIKKGTTYLGMATIHASFDSRKADWWKGGEAFIKMANTHGGEPSATLVGDFQGVSNIEAGNLTWLYELWFRQSIGNLTFTAGLQDLNVNFATDDCAGIFTNSSFGIHSSIADNIPSPIFPLTALGVNLKWNISPSWIWQAAIFDGTPDDLENNPYNTNWKLSKDQGFLLISEVQLLKSLVAEKHGSYKLGGYYHQHNDDIDKEQKNGGVYFVGNQKLTDNLTVFSQIGLSPKSINNHNHYYSLGCTYSGLLHHRPDDYMGVAIAYAGIDSNQVGSETAVELTYHCQICSNIYVRPDIQYIINPAGTDTKLENALVGLVRFGVEF